MKTLRDYLEGIAVALLCGLLVMLIAGCSLMQPRAKPAPVDAPTITGTIKTKHEIDAVALVKALDDADCELVSIAYEEGKKKAAFIAKCKGAIELPE